MVFPYRGDGEDASTTTTVALAAGGVKAMAETMACVGIDTLLFVLFHLTSVSVEIIYYSHLSARRLSQIYIFLVQGE